MIEFPTWRELFYKLAEEYPDCLMLNFTVKVNSIFLNIHVHVRLLLRYNFRLENFFDSTSTKEEKIVLIKLMFKHKLSEEGDYNQTIFF